MSHYVHLLLSTLFLRFAVGAAAAAASHNPIYYSYSWSGPAQLQQNGSLPFSSVEATIIIPHLELPTHPEKVVDEYSASFWIGIDGYKTRGLWQAGVVMHLWGEGRREIVPFWEWYPDAEHFVSDIDDFEVFEGEHLHVLVGVSGDGMMGTATLHNLNSTKRISGTRYAPGNGKGLDWVVPGGSVEWVVESGTYPNDTRMVLPDWGEAVFYDARAYRRDGSVVLLDDEEGLQVFESFGSELERLYTRTELEGTKVRIGYIEEECGACKEECLMVKSCADSREFV